MECASTADGSSITLDPVDLVIVTFVISSVVGDESATGGASAGFAFAE